MLWNNNLLGGGTITSVAATACLSVGMSSIGAHISLPGSISIATNEIIVNVFPRPIGSAIIPP